MKQLKNLERCDYNAHSSIIKIITKWNKLREQIPIPGPLLIVSNEN